MTTKPNTEIIHESDRTTIVPNTISQELAAISVAILDKEAERTETNKKLNSVIKKLKARQRDLAQQIRTHGGVQLDLSLYESDDNEEAEA